MGPFNSVEHFAFNLPEGYSLCQGADCCYIAGKRPKRQINITEDTYKLLNQLLAVPKEQNIVCTKKQMSILLTLGAKGYFDIKIQSSAWNNEDMDLSLPVVSVIIPVKDRPEDIRDCLNSLYKVDYPKDRLEIIVVDDGSTDHTPEVAAELGAKVIRRSCSGGPSMARNAGVAEAAGEVIAFLDSDCTVDKTWLQELLPWLLAEGIGAVGGFVASYYNSSPLDKYEGAMSSLSMGKRMLYEGPGQGNFYVPTCNVLVRKSVYDQVGGLNPQMHLGEDVDLCWRLREAGFGLVYVTTGRAWHKHRNSLKQMLVRRLQYGTSEADLYKRHQDKRKLFPMPVFSLGFYLGLLLAVLTFNPWFLALTGCSFILSYGRKLFLGRKLKQPVGYLELVGIVWRSSFAFCYYLNFHIIRYYLIVLIVAGIFAPALWLALAMGVLSCALVDYRVKEADLDYFSFSFFYILEQLFYQVGVFKGCITHGYFRCYIVKWLITV